eukprot:UN14872
MSLKSSFWFRSFSSSRASSYLAARTPSLTSSSSGCMVTSTFVGLLILEKINPFNPSL